MVHEKEKTEDKNYIAELVGAVVTGVGTKIALDKQNAAKTFEAAKDALKKVNEEKGKYAKPETLEKVWSFYEEMKAQEQAVDDEFRKTLRINMDNLYHEDIAREFRAALDPVKRDFKNNQEMNTVVAVTAAVAVGAGIWLASHMLSNKEKPSNQIDESSSVENQGLVEINSNLKMR
jgi:hypothetical protein